MNQLNEESLSKWVKKVSMPQLREAWAIADVAFKAIIQAEIDRRMDIAIQHLAILDSKSA